MITDDKPQSTLSVRIRLREFCIPPINDALVMGKKAPIGSEAMKRALTLLHVSTFTQVAVDDDLVDNILVRESLLNKIEEGKLVELVLRRVKPFMTIEEVTHLSLEPEVTLEEQL